MSIELLSTDMPRQNRSTYIQLNRPLPKWNACIDVTAAIIIMTLWHWLIANNF